MNRIRKRWLAPQMEAALQALPAVVLTGARQTGKTTLAQTLEERAFVSLDDLGTLAQGQSDPASLLASRPVTLDEVQRLPEMLLAIKRQVDTHRQAGDFLLTGSANLLLMSKVGESLAGRAVYLYLPPFCPVEWEERRGGLAPLEALFDDEFEATDWPEEKGRWETWLRRGGFPPVLSAPSDAARNFWFTGYVQTYLERDLRQLSAVSSLTDFQRVMALTANRCARLLNQSELARDAALPQPTVHRYLNLLETGFLVVRLSPYMTNPTTGLVKAKKVMWSDTGLAAWLAGIKGPEDLSNRLDRGFWLEQAVFQSLQSWRSLDPAGRKIYYWRDRAGAEVDFVLEKDGVLVALEIKASQKVTLQDAAGIAAFANSLGNNRRLRRGIVLHGGEASRSLGQDRWALPWGWLLPRSE